MHLTKAGQVFLQEVYQLFVHLDRAVRLTQQTGRGEIGQLVIGFTSSVAYDFLPALLRQFRDQFPAVQLVLQELTTSQQQQALREGRIHVGFGHPPLDDDDLHVECILQEPWVVALPETHPLASQPTVSVRSLAHESFILFPRYLGPGLYDQIVGICQLANFHPHVAQEAIQMQTVIGLVSGALGIALVPASLQNLQRTGVIYRSLQEPTPLVETALIWRRLDTSPLLDQFLTVVKATLP